MTGDVKTQRRYNSSRRRAQAAQTRGEIIDIASRRFLADGYAATTLSSIARGAGVSVETIHKAFGGKAGLVRAIWMKGLEGAGRVPAEQRSDAARATITDPRELIRQWGRLASEVAPRGSPILLLLRGAAATDPQLAAVLADAEEQRLRRMEVNARTLFERGQLRAGMTLERARDVLWTYSSPELWELLVVKRGWTPEQHGDFVAAGIIAALLPDANGSHSERPEVESADPPSTEADMGDKGPGSKSGGKKPKGGGKAGDKKKK